MTKGKLVELSGLNKFADIDYATPINEDGSYPEGVTAYYKDNSPARIVPLSELASSALVNQRGHLDIKDELTLVSLCNDKPETLMASMITRARNRVGCLQMNVGRAQKGENFLCVCGKCDVSKF